MRSLVNIDSRALSRIKACESAEEATDLICNECMERVNVRRTGIVSELFPSNKIWANLPEDMASTEKSTSDSGFIDSIIIAFEGTDAVNNAENAAKLFSQEKESNGMAIVEFGTYPIRDTYEKSAWNAKDRAFQKPTANKWYLVDTDGDDMVLLSVYSVANLEDGRYWIPDAMNDFNGNCFSEEEKRAMREKSRLLTPEEFDQYIVHHGTEPVCRMNPMDTDGQETIWAVQSKDEAGKTEYLMISRNGKLTSTKCKRNMAMGVRPMLKVSMTAFKAMRGFRCRSATNTRYRSC